MRVKSQGRVLGSNEVATPEPAQLNRPHVEDNPIDDKPRSVYEMITRQMLDDLRDDLAEIKGRVNTILWLMIGAILVELLVKIAR